MDQPARDAITGIILAGGRSQRMGRDKAALTIGGEFLLARVVRRLRPAVGAVLVVGPPERAALVPGIPVVADDFPGQGPLGGIATALRATATPYTVVVGCDMPFVRPTLVRFLASLAPGYDLVLPCTDHGAEPLHAVYASACLPAALTCLAGGERAAAALCARVRTRLVAPAEWAPYDPAGWSLFNANTAADWQRAETRVAAGGSEHGEDREESAANDDSSTG